VKVLSKLNASVLHFTLFPGNTESAKELHSMVEFIMEQPLANEKDLLNLCTLDNRTPLVFLVCHPALKIPPSVNGSQDQKARKDLMKMFTENIKDKRQILLAFDLIAQRRQLQYFEHWQSLITIKASSLIIPGQILHLVCRHDNATLLKWLMNQKILREHLNTADYAGYTPLLTATFYNSEKCVKELIQVCFYLRLAVIYRAVIGRSYGYDC
jgi:hypothetical protein